jgi:hypothetical protein
MNLFYIPNAGFRGGTSAGGLGDTSVQSAIGERDRKKMEWMGEVGSVIGDVEDLFGIHTSDAQATDQRQQRRASVEPDHNCGHGEGALS